MSYFCSVGTDGPGWIDNRGHSSQFPARTYYDEAQGYPYHALGASGTYVSFAGTCLAAKVNHTGNTTIDGFDWGYVDNWVPPILGMIDITGSYFRISDAIQVDGTPVNLPYIDFVKVQTAVNQMAGALGEVSTEAGIACDLGIPE
jgi:hypothetical protein